MNLDKKESADQNEFTSVFTLLVHLYKYNNSHILISMQVLSPLALAAIIFSMQQEALPFKQSPGSFVITVFILTVLVYVTVLFGKYALPPLARRIIALRVNMRDEVGEIFKILVGSEAGDALQPMKGPDAGKTFEDEEKAISINCGTRDSTNWRTGTTLG